MVEASWRNRIVGYAEVNPQELVEHPDNWRIHPKSQADALEGALEDVGWVQDIIVSRQSGYMIDGHLRRDLAIAKGETTVPVKYVDLDEREELLVLATLDPLSAMAGTNKEALESVLRKVRTDQLRVSELVASIAATAGIDWSEDVPEPPEPQIDRAEELREIWDTRRGQIWEIPSKTVPGKYHKIMCGDSTSEEDVARLMGGARANMVFTDPPYNVASEGRNYAADAPTSGKTYKALKNAEWDKDFDITAAFPSLEQMMAMDCACYVCTSQWLVHTVWEWMWKWSKFCSYCIWCKPNPMPSLAKRHWAWATEIIAYAVRGKHVANFPIEGHALNWWEVTSPSHTTDHPTEKPITIPARAIGFSSNRGAIVGDLFLGSGTTMVAAEQTGRLCYGCDIEPKYIGVCLQRMADMGLDPRLAE